MDPLSDVLSLLKPRTYVVRGFDLGGDWSMRFPGHEGVKCYALTSGSCWLAMDGVADPVHVTAGDCILLPRGRPCRLASDLSLPPLNPDIVAANAPAGAVTVFNGGGDCFGIGGYFSFAGPHASILLGVLPPIVHIRKADHKASLRWALEQMMHELRDPQPGGVLIAQHLAQMVLVQALRMHLADGAGGGVGWLSALSDRPMSAAITAMHANPAHRWTLQALAVRAGMSRSSFAARFKATVGVSPMDYLTRWRMLLAGDRLANGEGSVSVIALSLGYESESAFSTAFKRVMACSPRQYGRRANAAPHADPPELAAA